MKYTPIGDEVSVEAALVQASIAADATGKLAQTQKDSGRLLQVAEFWVKLADFMAGYEQAMSERATEDKPKLPTGFDNSHVYKEEEENARDFADFED